MNTNRRRVIELARLWLTESRALGEQIEELSGIRLRPETATQRRQLGDYLRALRLRLLDFFALEVQLLEQLQNLRGRYHHELGTCTEMILDEHHYVLSNLTKAIEYCGTEDPEAADVEHPQKLYFDAFYGYWYLLQDGVRSAIQLALPTFPSAHKREGSLAC